MKPVHITAGLLALIAGAIALYATKGSPLHRRAGMVFVAAMLAMSSTGALMALVAKPNAVNVMAGSITFYLVSTALLAVKRTVAQARFVLGGCMVAAGALAAWAYTLGFAAVASPLSSWTRRRDIRKPGVSPHPALSPEAGERVMGRRTKRVGLSWPGGASSLPLRTAAPSPPGSARG